MKIITLIRHSEALTTRLGQEDIHRELSKRGEAMAIDMGNRLNQNNIRPDIVYSSSAERAVSTCRLLCEAIQFSYQDVYIDPEIYFRPWFGIFFEFVSSFG